MSRGPTPRRLHVHRDLLRELKELVWRGRAIHLVVQGRGTEEIAQIVGWTARSVRKWKARFSQAPLLDTLEDADRSGRPARVPLAVRVNWSVWLASGPMTRWHGSGMSGPMPRSRMCWRRRPARRSAPRQRSWSPSSLTHSLGPCSPFITRNGLRIASTSPDGSSVNAPVAESGKPGESALSNRSSSEALHASRAGVISSRPVKPA